MMKLILLAISLFGASALAREPVFLNPGVVYHLVNSSTHYGDPKSGCMSDEIAVQIQGIAGDFCTSKCSFIQSCPTDVPTGVTAKPMCALQSTAGDQYCALICSPSSKDDTQCGTNASCKAISGVGLCTYDD
eukprot:CAMPEP_0167741128 /NCGR_PEP_ID=MMETSP0110_2-20121227/683_1 /TAXON_ID=629695 /ORGANISM="Gymnochlora sp., Strain CCMP2014" /LENGTH=131 /DNA_ID=CAMNT_0007625143 /DNA_START=21 /DNA_END=416 /DNA_ORIENTATION=-